jgi:hypothetical protein
MESLKIVTRGFAMADQAIPLHIYALGSPEFLSSHPDPGNRILAIQTGIQNIDQCP